MKDFKSAVKKVNNNFTRRKKLEVLQVNVGDKCNQKCAHCHCLGSPDGSNIMPAEVIADIIIFLYNTPDIVLDITGGAVELNPNLKYLIEEAKPVAREIIVRNNLTIFDDTGMEGFPEFYAKNNVKLVCSMPCYTRENVEKQRGKGVFDKSIKALKNLNKLGYGRQPDLKLDLTYNPGGAFLPVKQSELEKDYKNILLEKYAISFNNLITITNAPINRFREFLKSNGNYDQYMNLLTDNFNSNTTENIMCRNLLSVGWDGRLYDCDFNQAMGLELKDINELKFLKTADLENREITFGEHCFCCTAGNGSGCAGQL
ncbi:MAG: hypothetical protein A3J83_08620 [Elusimicrobia bacterium RIFOXYA2_FULL_40_6]|nr:MAG: hypothetical protein A3J83_08620 [Elusimicrobia bacterium RIFOXYA2_FULL_40_6]